MYLTAIFYVILLFISSGKCLDRDEFYKYMQDTRNSTSECEIQKSAFLNGLDNGDEWVMKSKLFSLQKY